MHDTACTTERDRSPRQWTPDERVTLSQAARIAPGKVSPNCVWRWCRRGVLARTGERVRLEHLRMGGRLYTTPRWIEEFGRRLAEADAAYFDATSEAPRSAPAPGPDPAPCPTSRPPRRRHRLTDHEEAERRARVAAELDAEGL